MMKISAILILMLALVCLSMADSGPSTTGDSPAGNSTTAPVVTSSSSSSSSSESSEEISPHNSTLSSDDDSTEHGGDDDSESEDDSHDDSESDDDNNYRPHGRYYHVRIIVVVTLEDIIALSNRTYELRSSLAEIFNISQKFVSIHFRLHGLHDVSSELSESDDSSESSESDGDKTTSSDDKSSEVHARGDKKFFEIIIDIRVPVDVANAVVTNSATVQTNMNSTLSNPQSKFSKALAQSGAQPQSTATSKVTTVTPINSTSTPAPLPPNQANGTLINSKTSSGTVVQTTAVMMLAGLVALVL